MAAVRLAPVPFEHVEAELAAFPIASESSFCTPLVELDPSFAGNRQKCFWRAAEREILSSIPSLALDEFVMVRDRVWFGERPKLENPQSAIPLAKYLHTLSTRHLDELGQPVGPVPQTDQRNGPSPHARLRWSWLCRALPPDLLRAARGLPNADDSPFQLSPVVERLLQERGFAETHLHLGAAADFSLMWANLMHALAVEEIQEKSFQSPGACFDDGRKLGKWVMWAAATRLVLAEWLFSSTGIRDRANLLDFKYASWCGRMDVVMISNLHRLISELVNGGEGSGPLPLSRGRTLYRLLIRPLPFLLDRREDQKRLRRRYKPRCRLDVLENDPLARIVGWHRSLGCSPETIFVRESLRYIMEKKENIDGDFDRLFWQVIRVRCLLYRHLVLRPLTPGLQWFVRFFSRIKPVRASLPDAVSMEAAVHRSGGGKGLRSLEVRLGTEESVSKCLDKIQQVKDIRTRPAHIEIGAVFHFSRDRGGGWRQGFPNAHGLDRSYPGIPPDKRLKWRQDVGNPSGFRFARYYLEQRRHAQALVSILRVFPRALRTVRGVDLCTDEAGIPIWVMAPLIRWIREAGRNAHVNFQDSKGNGIPQLQTTIHAGEDFVNLLTGLRRIDDAIRHLAMEEGDRIGHGVALGLDPEAWVQKTGRVIQTREERLFDLVWEWDCYANRQVGVESGRLAYLQSNIVRLGYEMFGESLTPEDLGDFIRKLHCEQELKILGFPDRSSSLAPTRTDSEGGGVKSQNMLRKYLSSTKVWQNGRVLETIIFDELGHELEVLYGLQRALRQKVGTLGLTVEVNPSSNLLISDLGHLEAHPIWRLSRPLDGVPPLSVCIGSDDPLTIATDLPHEYQLLFDRMVQSGQSHEVALDWLDRARDAGMRGRFTLPRATTRCPKKLTPSLFGVTTPVPPP